MKKINKLIFKIALWALFLLPFGEVEMCYCQGIAVNGFGTAPDISALLDVDASGMTPKRGILIPRVTLTSSTDATTILTPQKSLLVYNTGTGALSPAGYYYNQGTTGSPDWMPFLTNNGNTISEWSNAGNIGTTASNSIYGVAVNNNFIGPTDTKDFVFASNNLERMRITTGGQIGIGTKTPATLLDVTSTTAGFSMPRMTTVQRLAIASPIAGLQVYDMSLHGFYFYNGTKWDCVTIPAGTVNYFANSTTPIGYLECNGQSVSTSTYPELFAAIAYTYGGAGATFMVPDLRGEFIRGWDHGRNVDAARAIGSAQTDRFQGHYHDLIYEYTGFWGGGSLPAKFTTFLGAGTSNQATTLINDGTNGNPRVGNESRPRNVALLPCIKY